VTESDSQFLHHTSCPACGSSDANGVYDDGHTYCHSCQTYVAAPSENKKEKRVSDKGPLLPVGEIKAIQTRFLNKATCEKFGYFVTTFKDKPAQVAPYHDKNGKLVAQKIRMPGKEFTFAGNPKESTLFGQHLWKMGGKRLVITEGEIDAMSVAQAMGLTWPVVSVPNGASGAAKSVKANIEFVESYDEVVIMFDNDEPGTKAASEVAELLTPGKAKVAVLSEKDPNDMLKAGKTKELVSAVWEAQVRRPDGIVSGADLWDKVSEKLEVGVRYPWEGLNRLTYGLRKRELVTLSAGSGIGKSAVCREIAYKLGIVDKETLGYVALEESVGRSAKGLMGIHLDKPIHLPGNEVPGKEMRKAFDEVLGPGRYHFFDHFGSLDSENLMSKLRYMVKGLGCGWIILDHISIVVSGMELDEDERRTIDKTMTTLRAFVEETGCGLILVSHLKRPEGKGHEEGAKTSLAQLRGSAAIGQLSDIVLGLERNQQASTEEERNTTVIRVLKNRYSGDTGVAAALRYSKETGRLSEVQFFEDEDGVHFDPEPTPQKAKAGGKKPKRSAPLDDDIPF
jgi:twinkle protein